MLANEEGSCQTAALLILIQKEEKRWEFGESVATSICLMKLVPLGVRARASPLGARTALTRFRQSRNEFPVPSIELSHQGRFFGTDQTDLPRGEWFTVGGEG